MENRPEPTRSWSVSPSAKAKNAVERSVTALLDALAPERVLKRVEQLPGPVEQHRTPSGCVLQAATAAVTVSWFPSGGADTGIGELHVLVWHGSVARRGAGRAKQGATLITELVLLPVEPSEEGAIWRSADGTRYDTAALAAKCISLLEEQVVGAGTPPSTRTPAT